ncbi:Exocyst complex component exo84 [Cyphellophora attinorum]|uniref:Exocyst complex component EXO84 n=1 Tax=Cyphellophora attinorum TaxID=1664694 RepID=A0A0N0NKT9_9EURO|nr:Exocyst complex component exo84 [Phialophora attinorum]KPI38418.1 Exocyst complex component exo84 [Phialophora attinorum]
MSEGRSLTLRKKRKDRPKISGPQTISAPRPLIPGQPTSNAQASSQSSNKRPDNNLSIPKTERTNTETSDLIKRRYSTRYNQLPNFGGGDAPAVPALPSALKRRSGGATSPKRPATREGGAPFKVDEDVLSDPNLAADRYVTSLLSNASETDIADYQNTLRRIKNRNSTNLQQSVYQNRTQFIKISKEAEKLKSEMQILRGLMGDLTGALSLTTSSSAATNGGGAALSPELSGSFKRRNANRSSVANLESMWNVQLQALWKNVEKSQKFLPAIPGRHIIMENGAWVELDSATWKPRRPVHLFLLNDHLLVASKKRKRMDPNVPNQGPAPTKLVAEECWSLQDIDMVDMSTTPGVVSNTAEERAIATAVTIRAAGRSLTYRSEKRDEAAKTQLLQTFRKAVEDLRKMNKVEISKSSPTMDSFNYFASRDGGAGLSRSGSVLSSLSTSRGEKPDILIEVDGKQQNFRWVESQIDELDIDIALQRFEEAVEKVEKLRKMTKTSLKSNTIAQELIQSKVDDRAAKLANLLCRELTDKPSYMATTKGLVAYLVRLGAEDQAREAYLSARSEALRKRSRQCVFEGDLHAYVFSISYVYFTMVKNTILIYQASFSAATMSAVIKWANEHLEGFSQILQRQMSSVDKEGRVWRECMDVVWEHEASQLGENGLDFRAVIGKGLEVREVKVPSVPKVPGGSSAAGSPAGQRGRSGSERSDRSGGRSKSRGPRQ